MKPYLNKPPASRRVQRETPAQPLPVRIWHTVAGVLRRYVHLPRPDGDALGRGVVCAALITLFALLQTTLFARFRPFGAIPDLMLSLVVAIAMTEGEKWGAVCGIAAALVIDSLGAGDVFLTVLLYMPVGYFCPVLTKLYLTDTAPVRVIYTLAACVGRMALTLICLALTVVDFHLPALLGGVVLPEFASTALLACVPHLLVRVCLHPFHRSRAERVTTL